MFKCVKTQNRQKTDENKNKERDKHEKQEEDDYSSLKDVSSVHSRKYTLLLSAYIDSTKKSNSIKNGLKILFFLSTIGILIYITYIFSDTLKFAFSVIDNAKDNESISLETILSLITVIVPSISSLIVAFIKIPEIIAKYLFNTKEDDSVKESRGQP